MNHSLPPFESLVTTYGSTVLRVCRSVLGPDDADDAWSETFISALRAYPDQPADTRYEAWLVTIAHRKAIDLFRARGRRPVPIAELPMLVAVDGQPGFGPDADLTESLAALPEKQRLSISYHYLADLPYDQVSDLLGGSPAAARRAAADGIKTLRVRLPDTNGAS